MSRRTHSKLAKIEALLSFLVAASQSLLLALPRIAPTHPLLVKQSVDEYAAIGHAVLYAGFALVVQGLRVVRW